MSEPALEPVDGEPVEPAEDAWAGPSQEEWQATQDRLAAADELVQSVRSQQNGDGGPLAEYDPEFRQALDQWYEQKNAPYQSFQQQEIARQAEEQLKDLFHDVSVRDGEFDVEMARYRYETKYVAPMVQKYGATIRAAEEAVAAAAREQRDYEAQVRAAAVEQYQNQLRGISQVPREPAAAGHPAGTQHVTPEGGDENALVRAYFPTTR